MPNSNVEMIRKLQIALNGKGQKILIDKDQFYSEQQDRPVTMYTVSKSRWNEDKGKTEHVKLFKTASQIQVVLFLRNLWYLQTGKEIPPTNKIKGSEEFERKWKEYLEEFS